MSNAVALREAAERLGIALVAPLHGGGSSATTWLGTDDRGTAVVVKCLSDVAGLLDGHDLETFRTKPKQIAYLRDVAPLVARRYPRILATVDDVHWTAHVFERLDKLPLADALGLSGGDAGARMLTEIWGRLAEEGYSQRRTPVDPNRLWHSLYMDRITRRQWLVRENAPSDLMAAPTVVINGRVIRGLDRLLAEATDLGRIFAGAELAAPVHGDLNLRNIMTDPRKPEEASLIDPRGTLADWDPYYDLAKMLFSASIFDAGMAGGFVIERSGPEFTVFLKQPRDSDLMRCVELSLPRMATDVRPRRTKAATSHPVSHALLAHACHLIAEAANRLSVRQDEPMRRHNRAMGLLLFGMLLFDDLVERRGRMAPEDIEEHLNLIV